MNAVAVIPARGGSRGIPRKNLMPICGHPLIAWSIRQALDATRISEVYVTSDSDEILETALKYGARAMRRPVAIAGDTASSESAWLHALDQIEPTTHVDVMIGMQATSPIREAADLDRALETFEREQLDSSLSCCEVEDFFMWRVGQAGPESVNYDFRDRKPRQKIEPRYLENGSFYLFRPALLRQTGNRLGGRIGLTVMARHKMFQIDNPGDAQLCEAIMRGYGLDHMP